MYVFIREDVVSELKRVLEANSGQIGKVYQLALEGKTTTTEIVDAGAAANTSAASNIKIIIDTILTADIPNSPSRCAQVGRAIGGILKTSPNMGTNTRIHLEGLRSALDNRSENPDEISKENTEMNSASDKLERSVEELDGVYVYTYPTYFRTVQKADPERYLYKVGKTTRANGLRIKEQQRGTNVPEDPWTLRIYRSDTLAPEEIEALFHKVLVAAGHVRSSGRYSGAEWFYTNLDFLDSIAQLLKVEIHKIEH